MTWTDSELDSTFKVGVIDQKLYMYDGSSYVELLSSDFKAENQIYLS